MKKVLLAASLMLSIALSGCGTIGFAGGTDRQTLAKQAVQTYWKDVTHGKMSQAYDLLSPGVQAGVTRSDYGQNMIGLLQRAGSITVTIKTPQVNGDSASVPVVLHSPLDKPLPGYQHLFWINGGWKISDNNAYISQHR